MFEHYFEIGHFRTDSKILNITDDFNPFLVCHPSRKAVSKPADFHRRVVALGHTSLNWTFVAAFHLRNSLVTGAIHKYQGGPNR